MRTLVRAIMVILLTAGPSAADDRKEALDFGGDSFRAGGTVIFDTAGTDDLFMAGETVRGAADIAGSAHLAGRKVAMEGAVGGDAYLAGMDVRLTGDVAGDATLAGYDLRVGPVGGDLRVSGAKIAIEGPVSGYALIGGEEIRIASVLGGDVSLAARSVDFAEGARIGGQLILYEHTPGTLVIPETVIPEARIERREISGWDEARRDHHRSRGWAGVIGGFVLGVIVVAALAALVAAIIPQTLAEMRRRLLARPFRNLGAGFVTQSALVGSAVLFAMTIIGVFLSPASILVALAAGFAGYVVAVYAFGVGLLLAFGRPEPDSIGQRALAAGTGALVAGLLGLIPLLGWLFVLALVLAGVGAITLRIARAEAA